MPDFFLYDRKLRPIIQKMLRKGAKRQWRLLCTDRSGTKMCTRCRSRWLPKHILFLYQGVFFFKIEKNLKRHIDNYLTIRYNAYRIKLLKKYQTRNNENITTKKHRKP